MAAFEPKYLRVDESFDFLSFSHSVKLKLMNLKFSHIRKFLLASICKFAATTQNGCLSDTLNLIFLKIQFLEKGSSPNFAYNIKQV